MYIKMKRGFLVSFVLVASLSLLSGCKEKEVKVSEEKDARILVNVAQVFEQEIDIVANFSSNIEAFQTNNISPHMPVRIDKINVEVGDKVKKGEMLAVMDQTQYNQSKVQVATLSRDFARMKAVYEDGGISLQELDQIETQLEVQQEALEQLAENLELCSPITGVVTGRYYDEGDLFSMTPNASGIACVLQVMQIDTLKVKFAVSERYFPDVKMGLHVDIATDIYPNDLFDGEVSLIYPTIDPATKTFTVEVTVPNKTAKLRPGMYSNSTIIFGKENGILVPDLAVMKQVGSNERYIYLIENGVVHRTTVTLGRQVGEYINLISGLSGNEIVAVEGLSRLFDGAEVEIKKN